MKAFLKHIVVRTLTWEASVALRKHKPRIIAITGSVGKTTTKDAIAAALAPTFDLRKSEKSLNSEIGLPLTILGLANPWTNPLAWISALIRGFFVQFHGNYPSWLVLEVGADHPGDIRSLSRWLHTDIVVFTRFADTPVHVEYFASPEAVLEEKLSLLHTLKPEGVIVVNADDKAFANGIEHTNRRARVVTFGMMPPADVVNPNIRTMYDDHGRPAGIEYDIQTKTNTYSIQARGVLGSQHIYPALAAFAVARATGADETTASDSLSETARARGRMNILAGVKQTTLIDDSYNSSPVAAHEALHVLRSLDAPGKKIAVLGDMLELGDHAEREHKALGEEAAVSADVVIGVGNYARYIAEGALEAGLSEKHIIQSRNADQAGKAAELRAREGDILLFKGSQSTRMERAVLEMLAEPKRAPELLVRQEREWEKR